MNGVASTSHLNNPKVVRGWYMYDWANSVYSLVITTAIFPIYYKAVAVSPDGSDMVTFLGFTIQNSVLYTYALSFSFLIVAAMLPILSGAADYTGNKKIFMKFFVWLGSLSCMALFFFETDTLYLGILFSILASIGYSSSLVFYDAFLPEIVTPDRYDQTSARGYSMGYYGSVLLMIICTVLTMNHEMFQFAVTDPSETEGLAVRICFVLVGAWWLGFSFIPFSILPDNPFNKKPSREIWTKGYDELVKVWRSFKATPDLRRFIAAYFFYNMGVQTVMYLATLFGTDVLHLGTTELIGTVVIIQLVGAVGAGLFSRLSGKKGNRFSLIVMIFIWIWVCVAAYFITNAYHFYFMATVVGLIMGGIQSLSRATYSKLIPENTIDHASYFSFYDVTYNLSIVFGTFSYGLINQITGSMRYSALALAVYFVVGMAFLLIVKSSSIQKSLRKPVRVVAETSQQSKSEI
jgi:MFS transporter, UMF1 family